VTAFSLDDYYDVTLVTDTRLAPDGDRAAYVADEFVTSTDERRQAVFVVSADGSGDPHRLTRAYSAADPKWSPDGSKLAVRSDRTREPDLKADVEAENALEESAMQVWVFDLERGGDARQVTNLPEGVRGFDWGPNGERLVVSARDPTDDEWAYLEGRREDDTPVVTERLQHKYDGEGWLDTVQSYLFEVDVETRETTRIDEAHGGKFEPVSGMKPTWSPDGTWIAFFANRTEHPDDSLALDLYFFDYTDGDIVKVTDSDVAALRGVWSPDGNRYAFAARNPNSWSEPPQLYVVDLDCDGAVGEPRSVSASLDRPIAPALSRDPSFEWLDEQTLIGAVGDRGQTRLVRFDATDDSPERVFEQQAHDETVGDLDVAAGTATLVLSDPAESPDVYALDADDLATPGERADLRRLTRTNSGLHEQWPTPTCHRFAFESDGEEIEALLYAPSSFDPDSSPELPLLVSIHGGPVLYDEPSFDFEYLHWVNEGYLVLRVNYRGSTSYGQAFCKAIEGEYGNKEPGDVVAGIQATIDRGWATPDDVCVTGFSYGGAQTAYILSQYDVATVGAAEHGVYDRSSYFGTGDSHNRMERDFGLPWEEPEVYEEISSITDVDGIDVPLLVTAGGEDARCPPSQSEQLYVSVKKRDVPARLVVYPDEHHNIGDPDRALHRLEELTRWFERHG
jgi:dipeptidyl aminopeptidase/acylaminoacyl peptidase